MSTDGILLEAMGISGIRAISRKFHSSESEIEPTRAKNYDLYIQFIFKSIEIRYENHQKFL